jgi:hypothetical protein
LLPSDNYNSIDYGFSKSSTVPPSETPGLNKPSKKQKRMEDSDAATTRATELSITDCHLIAMGGDVIIYQNPDQHGLGSSATTYSTSRPNSVWCAHNLGSPAGVGRQGNLIRHAIDVKIIRRESAQDGPMNGVMFGMRTQINPDVKESRLCGFYFPNTMLTLPIASGRVPTSSANFMLDSLKR